MRKPRNNISYKDKYLKAVKQLAVKQKALKEKALKLMASEDRFRALDEDCGNLADECDEAVAQLNEAIKARNVTQKAEQLWHDNKIILAILLEQRAREAELDLSLSTDKLGDEHLTAR